MVTVSKPFRLESYVNLQNPPLGGDQESIEVT